jgi:hypothetical protein
VGGLLALDDLLVVRSIFSSRSCDLYLTVKKAVAVATAAMDQNTRPR